MDGPASSDALDDPEFAAALDEFIADFVKDRGLSWECAIQVFEAKIAQMRAELKRNE